MSARLTMFVFYTFREAGMSEKDVKRVFTKRKKCTRVQKKFRKHISVKT